MPAVGDYQPTTSDQVTPTSRSPPRHRKATWPSLRRRPKRALSCHGEYGCELGIIGGTGPGHAINDLMVRWARAAPATALPPPSYGG
jgi:hypothetical protein